MNPYDRGSERYSSRNWRISDEVRRLEAREEARTEAGARLRENCKISHETGLLDRFALGAMTAFLRQHNTNEEAAEDAESVARHAYAVARAMMRQRSK